MRLTLWKKSKNNKSISTDSTFLTLFENVYKIINNVQLLKGGKMQKNSNRMNKIDEQLKKEISYIISQELRDSHITGLISVTKVVTTPDLSFARVYVSMINAKSNKENLARLKKSAGYIRTLIAKKVNLRVTPELIFEFDESLEYGSRIDSIIKEITQDLKREDN